jgi:hypothetical protein
MDSSSHVSRLTSHVSRFTFHDLGNGFVSQPVLLHRPVYFHKQHFERCGTYIFYAMGVGRD